MSEDAAGGGTRSLAVVCKIQCHRRSCSRVAVVAVIDVSNGGGRLLCGEIWERFHAGDTTYTRTRNALAGGGSGQIRQRNELAHELRAYREDGLRDLVFQRHQGILVVVRGGLGQIIVSLDLRNDFLCQRSKSDQATFTLLQRFWMDGRMGREM